jgi:hypothetical protein
VKTYINEWEVDEISLRLGVEANLGFLEYLRDDGRVPSCHLLKDIAGYKWLLSNDDALIRKYFETKHSTTPRLKTYEACEKIGWKPHK